MSLRQLPNAICVARIALVVPIAITLLDGDFVATLWLFALAAFSDGLDGYLAKRFGWTTELGKFLDPLADKLLLVTVFITLAVAGLTPVWLAVIVVARDVIIGALLGYNIAVRGKPGGEYEDSKEDHWALNGMVFEWSSPPLIPGTTERAHPGERIQCRCLAIPVIDFGL